MKISAVLRIILYSVLTIILTGILLTGLGIGSLSFGSSDYTTGGDEVDAAKVESLEIDWAAGSITIQTADTDKITFSEKGNFTEKQAMAYRLDDGVLHISFSKPPVNINFSDPSKHLTITVPKGWSCESLDLDGAAIEVSIRNLDIDELNLDGAAMELEFDGALKKLSCDGAACEMKIRSSRKVDHIEIDGAACALELELPEDCGFRVECDGVVCQVRSDVDHKVRDQVYTYGDEGCVIQVNGISCDIKIGHQ